MSAKRTRMPQDKRKPESGPMPLLGRKRVTRNALATLKGGLQNTGLCTRCGHSVADDHSGWFGGTKACEVEECDCSAATRAKDPTTPGIYMPVFVCAWCLETEPHGVSVCRKAPRRVLRLLEGRS